MILLAFTWLVGGGGGPQASVSNLWDRGGFSQRSQRPGDDSGDHHVLLRAGCGYHRRQRRPSWRKVIPKAINRVIYRILIFYIGVSWRVIRCIHMGPVGGDHQRFRRIDYSGSPFVQIFSLIGSGTAANILNFVVLIRGIVGLQHGRLL